ncbi:cytochrome o ubiquinol oxidase subunit III [Vibrio parahaemolyticus]|uniref:cytochrome o ubiquinol oxidase subunit III n=1 Tax=Vibrio parahaemolyticus TaxID=670 RepID=UPI0001564580|nr:cytochrome o ubiquinol oxidase subunit III [Vibrio parahaemolyticus]KIT49172.1 cytochrome O ubiquinol oxidase [Vibrio parahaemolyticus 901128]AWG81013.1 cytochrome o ubiquinol oxidase subunit III [Vibrio parahaemolyticus]AWJ81302.1 cytochrome o ubiquinol oxidase subunit III [Vibrio parahaemolyticus]EDM59885.1 cytOchrome o ubiquinol oxidase, subunit III [Vibrio parahaemolyticus AQ3810]EGQ8258897.1 cytochrome o ubiquinol oxidase subunit III [Vibrio parahaemolyticus]
MQTNVAAHHDHDHHHDTNGNKLFGFWVYLMSDCVLFATLFATYAVLSSNSIAGPTGKEIFELPFVFVETMLLLFSSITFGFGIIAMKRNDVSGLKRWMLVTFALGLGFICMEVYEFHHLIKEGYGPQTSAFLSAFFTLVGTHGLHVTFGLIWLAVAYHQLSTKGLNDNMAMRFNCLSLFWHFLDIVWICVFTIVYLMGVM